MTNKGNLDGFFGLRRSGYEEKEMCGYEAATVPAPCSAAASLDAEYPLTVPFKAAT